MAASIGSHFENIKSQYLQNKNPIFMQFASKWAVFQILLDKINLYFCVPFPLNFQKSWDMTEQYKEKICLFQVHVFMLNRLFCICAEPGCCGWTTK